jgi:hypothetical protein
LERILERPAARCIQTPHDVSRRQSNNVNVEDILQHQVSKIHFFFRYVLKVEVLFYSFPPHKQNGLSLQRFTTIFELGTSSKSAHITRPSIEDLNSSALAQIAEFVASTAEILNIPDVSEWLKDKPYQQCSTYGNDDADRASVSKSILCMPIVNGQKRVIGVAQLINKVSFLTIHILFVINIKKTFTWKKTHKIKSLK